MKRPVRALTLLYLLSLLFLFSLDIRANAETVSGPFREGCPRYPVCLMNGVTLNTKYGQLVSQRNMIFNWFSVNANGSIYFDARNMIPNAMEILIFKLQSYGNGSFDIRVIGPPATAVACQDCSVDSHLSANLAQGQGAELFFNSNMLSSRLLIINYTPFGGGCIPACIGATPFWVWILFLTGAGLLGVLIISSRRKVEVEKDHIVTIGGEA